MTENCREMARKGIAVGANVALHTDGVAIFTTTRLFCSPMPGKALSFRLHISSAVLAPDLEAQMVRAKTKTHARDIILAALASRALRACSCCVPGRVKLFTIACCASSNSTVDTLS